MRNAEVRTDEEMTEIYNRYCNMVYQIAFLHLKNVPDTEDVTQTVFIRLLTSRKRFMEEEHLKAWLIVTTQNICRDMLRRFWRTKRVESKLIQEESTNFRQSNPEVWSELLSLDEKYKLPLYLFYYEGYRTQEIAEMLQTNHATIRTRLRVARKKLKLLVEEGENFEAQ